MKIRNVYGCAVLLVCAGCASMAGLAPNERTLGAEDVATAKTFGKVRVSPASWPAADWWHQYGDAQLEQLIGEAQQGNPDLAVAQARVRLSAAQTLGADAARDVQVNAKASLPGAELPKTLLDGAAAKYSTFKMADLGANYDFDLWGGARASWEAALGTQHATEVDEQAAELLLVTRIAQTYNSLGYAFTSNDIARDDLARAQSLLVLTRQRVDAGLDAVMQLRQAEVAAASAEQSVSQTAQQIETARIQLAVLLGQGPDRALRIGRPHPMRVTDIALPENLPAELLGRRPDIVAARWRVEAAGHGIDVAKAKFYPNVNLSATLGLLSAHTSDLFEVSSSRFALLTPAVSLPIFDRGRLRSNLAGADAEYDIAVTQYNKTLVTAFNEVADELNQLSALQTQAEAQQRAASAAQQAWDLASQRYKNGVGGYLDVLTVQQSLHSAQSRLAEIESHRVSSSLDLVRSLGGGYGAAEPDKSLNATSPAESH